MAYQGPDAPHPAAAEESLAWLDEGDERSAQIGQAAALGGRRIGDARARAVLAKLAPRDFARLVSITRAVPMTPEHSLALAVLLAEPRAQSMRDDEAVEIARQAATDARAAAEEDVLAGALAGELVDRVVAYGALPRVQVLLPTIDRGARELVTVKPGAHLTIIGGTGAGKTSMALEIARCHERWTGPALVFGLELSVEETAARLVGQGEMLRWMDASELPRERLAAALGMERLYLFGRVNVAAMRARVRAVKARWPEQAVLIVVDYAQILVDDVGERGALGRALEELRVMVKEELVVCVVTSQTSRANSDALRSGEKLGKETTETGAESSQIERGTYVTLALGEQGEDDGHGWRTMDLSVGKSRMGQGDLVLPLRHHGASGRFEVLGDAEKAAEVRARRVVEREARERKAIEDKAEERVRMVLERMTEPVGRRLVEEEAGGRRDEVRAAVRRMLTSGEIVEVGQGARANYRPPIALARLMGNHDQAAQAAQSGPSSGPRKGRLLGEEAAQIPRRGSGAASPGDQQELAGEKLGPGRLGSLELPFLGAPAAAAWVPGEEHRAFAAKHGVDLDSALAAFSPGPGPRDPQFLLLLARFASEASRTPGKAGE